MTNKNSRPSPSESATLFPVGTKKVGNDDFMYKIILTSNNTKRWAKDKDTTSTKKQSTKKRSVKQSTKKRSVKQSTKKRSTKKRSKKRSVKRSTKKRSTKKRSTKKKSTKKRSTKKRSTKKRSASAKKRVSKKLRTNKKKSHKRSNKSTKNKSVNRRSSKRKTPRNSSKSRSRSSQKANLNVPIPKKFNKQSFSTMLAHKYNGQDPTGYYISEKLDGYRAIYDGESDSFMSRTNKPFYAPKFFTEKFPRDLVLDGELYIGRDNFAGTGIFRKKIPVDSEWRKGTYQVFDMPLINLPFSERYALMKKLLKNIPYLEVVEHSLVKDIKHMDSFHKNIISKKGEGSMLRKADSYYENKRSHNLLKVKDFFDDEVEVIGYEMGEGRNEKRLGALHVKWVNQKMGTNEFKVGSGFDDNQRDNYKKLFPIKKIITIKYFEIDKHSKKPRFPTFLRIKEKE